MPRSKRQLENIPGGELSTSSAAAVGTVLAEFIYLADVTEGKY